MAGDPESIWSVESMYDAAALVGDALREMQRRDGPFLQQLSIEASANLLVGGQIGNEKLFVQDLGFFRNRGRRLVDDDFKHFSIIAGAKPTKRTRKAISKIAKTPVPNLKKSFDFFYGCCIPGTAQSPTNPKF